MTENRPNQDNFLAHIIQEIFNDVAQTHKERLTDNVTTNLNQKLLDSAPDGYFVDKLKLSGLNTLPNVLVPKLTPIDVYTQADEISCGFHMYCNALTLAKAIVADTNQDQLLNLTLLKSAAHFWREHKRMLKLLLLDQSITQENRDQLISGDASLERESLQFLLQNDRELDTIKNNKRGIKVRIAMLEHSFGLLHRTPDQIKKLHKEISDFKNQPQEQVFVIFIAVVSHWVALVVHKQSDLQFYLLDSDNFGQYDKTCQKTVELMKYDKVWEKIEIGQEPYQKWHLQVATQSAFDQRALFPKLIAAFSQSDYDIVKIYTNSFLKLLFRDYALVQAMTNQQEQSLEDDQLGSISAVDEAKLVGEVPTFRHDRYGMSKDWLVQCLEKFKIDTYEWELSEFLNCQRRPPNKYCCFSEASTDEELRVAYQACNSFLINGHQAKFLRKETLNQLDHFGHEGFLLGDLSQVFGFTGEIISIMDRISERPLLQAELFREDMRTYIEFSEVASMSKVIKERFEAAVVEKEKKLWRPKYAEKKLLEVLKVTQPCFYLNPHGLSFPFMS